MIRGLGVDLIAISRISGTLARRGDRFLKKMCHPTELTAAKALVPKQPLETTTTSDVAAVVAAKAATDCAQYHRFVATRWAAKEAIYKAFGQWRIPFPDVEIVPAAADSPPRVVLHGEAARVADAAGIQVRLHRRHKAHLNMGGTVSDVGTIT